MPDERREETGTDTRRHATGDRATGQEPGRPRGRDEIAQASEEVLRESGGPEKGPPAGEGPVPED